MAGAPIYSGDADGVVVVGGGVVVVVVVTISPQHKSDVYTLLLSQVTLVLGRATGIPRVSC